jgi:hypothetical protein
MPLIVEDGSGVVGANSYITLAFARNYAATRGVTLSNDDTALSVLLVKATDYLETKRFQYLGYLVNPLQALAFPRNNLFFGYSSIPSNVIPIGIQNAQAELVIEQTNGVDLQPTVIGGPVIVRERIDVIETQYSERLQQSQPFFPKVDALLRPYLRNSGALTVKRA